MQRCTRSPFPCYTAPMTRQQIEALVEGELVEGELLFADGFNDCIIGVHRRTFDHAACVVYDRDAMIQQLIGDGLTFEEAEEHFDFNVAGAYMGKHTPIYVSTEAGISRF